MTDSLPRLLPWAVPAALVAALLGVVALHAGPDAVPPLRDVAIGLASALEVALERLWHGDPGGALEALAGAG